MSSKEHLQEQLRRQLGGNCISTAKMLDVSSLTSDQLKNLVREHDLEVLGTRKDMEKALIEETGRDEFFVTENVPIDSLSLVQLETLVDDIIPPVENNEANNEIANLGRNNERNSGHGRTIKVVQQEMAMNCGFKKDIIWDL